MTNTNENTQQESTKRRGRPNKQIIWPTEAFSAEDVHNLLDKSLSRVSVHSKINKAVLVGELISAGFSKPTSGRPKNLYKRAA